MKEYVIRVKRGNVNGLVWIIKDLQTGDQILTKGFYSEVPSESFSTDAHNHFLKIKGHLTLKEDVAYFK